MTTKTKKYLGIWETKSGDSALRLSISIVRGRLRVTAYDKDDGEVFKILSPGFERGWLVFDLLVPSTKLRTTNRFRVGPGRRAILEYTIREAWKRVVHKAAPSVASAAKRRSLQ